MRTCLAVVAQLAEQRTENPCVDSSILSDGIVLEATFISIFALFIFIPFVFAIVFVFFLVCKKSFAMHVLLLTVLFSFFAIFISSILQLFIFRLFYDFLKRIPISFFQHFFHSFIYSGFIEEVIKFFFFYCVLVFFVHPYIQRAKGISYSDNIRKRELILLVMFFASCFAGFENIAYILLNTSSWDIMWRYISNLLCIRLFTASLFHIFVSQYYLKAISKENRINFAFLLIPIFLHGIYNFFVAIGGVFFKISIVIIIFLLVRTYQNYRK